VGVSTSTGVSLSGGVVSGAGVSQVSGIVQPDPEPPEEFEFAELIDADLEPKKGLTS